MIEILADLIEISPELKEAFKSKKPILALETAVLTHGLPFPDNVELVLKLEEVVRLNGAIPATIGVVKGKIKIGLSQSEIEFLGETKESLKLSARDISYALKNKLSGGTTVSATIYVSSVNGIKVFSTGGIGGVHRGWEKGITDVSQDLTIMSEYEVFVVSAGVKAILDIPKTIEYLETLGIPIVGYQTNRFPAFYSTDTPFRLDSYFIDVHSLAEFLKIQSSLGQSKSVLILNSPPDKTSIPFKEVETYIAKAIADAKSEGIKGKELTPYLLSKVNYYSQGRTLHSNKDLLINNAQLGAKITSALNSIINSD